MKILFGTLFLLSVAMAFIYAEKPMITYNKSSVENSLSPRGGSKFDEWVTKTYQDNYASTGGAIGFAILGGASLLAFCITILKENARRF